MNLTEAANMAVNNDTWYIRRKCWESGNHVALKVYGNTKLSAVFHGDVILYAPTMDDILADDWEAF